MRSGDESSKKPDAARLPTAGANVQSENVQGAKVQGEKVQGAKVQNKDRDMGAALRTVYQRTVEETIPSEMLDLLSKLD